MNKQMFAVGSAMLVLGVGLGLTLALLPMRTEAPSSFQSAQKPLFYRNPMDPVVTSRVPTKDSMGMDYIPVYAQSKPAPEIPGMVTIDPVTVQNIGVRTARVEKTALSHHIRALGRVDFDEEKLLRLHPKTEGWIDLLHIDKTGQKVLKNEDLLSIYSPQLVASQQEYLIALSNMEALKGSPFPDIRRGAEGLVKSSRERLRLLDVPEHQIRDLDQGQAIKKSLHLHSPVDGVVMMIGAREGQYVTPQTELYRIADLSKVWVYADIYEYELPWVRVGDSVQMQLAGVPGKIFSGRVDYIYPYAEPRTRTIKVRLAFENPNFLLKPEMFAEVTIFAGRQIDAVVIPAEAVVRSGSREQVFVVRGPGKFEPRLVQLGISAEGRVQILEGLSQGEEVVVSSQFLIDSESKLREATAKMRETGREDTSHPQLSLDAAYSQVGHDH